MQTDGAKRASDFLVLSEAKEARTGGGSPWGPPSLMSSHPGPPGTGYRPKILTGLGVSPSMELLPLVIHSASSRADRGDYFCPQSGAIDDHAPSAGLVHGRTECVRASAGPLFPRCSVRQRRTVQPRGSGAPDRRQRRSERCSLRAVGGADLLRRTGREAGSSQLRGSPKANPALGIGWSDGDYPGLSLPAGRPAAPVQEKGVVVVLAVDFVKLAVEDAYDVGVIRMTLEATTAMNCGSGTRSSPTVLATSPL